MQILLLLFQNINGKNLIILPVRQYVGFLLCLPQLFPYGKSRVIRFNSIILISQSQYIKIKQKNFIEILISNYDSLKLNCL